MLETQAEVIAVKGQYARVQAKRESTCGGCAARSGCGTASISKVVGQRVNQLTVLNPIDAHVGDSVIISIPEETLLKGALIVYIVPLILMLLFAVFGGYLVPEWAGIADMGAIVGGIVGLCAGFVIVWKHSLKASTDKSQHPTILRQVMRVTPL